MKAKLIKSDVQYRLHNEEGIVIATSFENGKLSKQNCDEIFGVIDINKWANEKVDNRFNETDGYHKFVYVDGIVDGYNKAMELNKDKLFGVKEVVELCKILLSNPFEKCGKTYQELTDNYIQSLQKPKEIEVEIEQVLVQSSIQGEAIWRYKLDENLCLILKKL